MLDLKQESARKVLLRLAESADVFMHNYRPRAAARGSACRYEMFRAVNPRLVYVGTYGFRAAGPYADKPAYDDIIQAASGLASLQSALTGEPRFVPTIVADKTSSMTLFAAVLAALYHQARTGEGQEVEVPDVREPRRLDHGRASLRRDASCRRSTAWATSACSARTAARSRPRTAHLAILPYTDQNWRDFFALNGRQDLLEEERLHHDHEPPRQRRGGS